MESFASWTRHEPNLQSKLPVRRFPPAWSIDELDQHSGGNTTNKLTVILISLCAHTIRDKNFGINGVGVTVSKNSAGYQPVAWWFTKRRLGQELKLPAQLLALVRKLEGEHDRSLEAKGE
jgi:hypothetical protein